MKYIGKYGEHQVLSQLLARDIEAYLAISANQSSYDITAILGGNRVVRLQVKATELNNKSTNNPISNLDWAYDFLVLVVVLTDKSSRFFVLTKSEVQALCGTTKKLYTTCKQGKDYMVRENIEIHEDKWEKLHERG